MSENELETSEENAEATEETVVEESAPQYVRGEGLMQRRKSFSQSSVPNAHKGYNADTPVVMLIIISFLVVLSLIFATAAVIS